MMGRIAGSTSIIYNYIGLARVVMIQIIANEGSL